MRALVVLLAATIAAAGVAAFHRGADVEPGAGCAAAPSIAAPAAARPTAAPVRSEPRVTVDAEGALVRADQMAFAGRRRPAAITPCARGIRCPDGTHLPLLNGVRSAPAVIRAAEHGPLPPVVAVVVDAAGFDWYEHADGSMTTCRPQFVTDALGQREVQVITVHTADAPANGAVVELPAAIAAPPARR